MTNVNRSPHEPQCRRRAKRSAPRTLAWLLILLIAATVFAAAQACAAEHLRIAAQKTGTLAWELDIIRAAGLDRQHDLTIETTELASTEAGKIALKGGSADLIVTDWLWVGRERALGDNLVFYPYSSALGAMMAPANSNIRASPTSSARRSASPAGRSTRVGCCCGLWRGDRASI
jgi:NitT/TauT family transport system substrate-binding protein